MSPRLRQTRLIVTETFCLLFFLFVASFLLAMLLFSARGNVRKGCGHDAVGKVEQIVIYVQGDPALSGEYRLPKGATQASFCQQVCQDLPSPGGLLRDRQVIVLLPNKGSGVAVECESHKSLKDLGIGCDPSILRLEREL